MKIDKWKEFSEDYDNKVFSLTKVSQRRKQILNELKKGKVLNLGTGPTPYLNVDLIKRGNDVVASDFSKSMLDVAKRKFSHKNLTYLLSDSRSLDIANETFDSVISVNSILPSTRKDVALIMKEVYRVLKKQGKFIAFLCSYDNIQKIIRNNPDLNLKTDDSQLRLVDTVGWQCFHTPKSIEKEVTKAGFSRFDFHKTFLRTKQEIDQLQKIYSHDTSKSFTYEYFLTAHKD